MFVVDRVCLRLLSVPCCSITYEDVRGQEKIENYCCAMLIAMFSFKEIAMRLESSYERRGATPPSPPPGR